MAATLAVGPGVTVWIQEYVTLTDSGNLIFASNDTVDLNIGTTQIVVANSGLMTTAIGDIFNGSTAYSTQIVVNSGGHLQASNSTFALATVNLNSGSTDTVQYSTFATELAVNSGASINITSNDFSSANATVVASGDPNATINLDYNYWGTTNSSQIAAKITDHSDSSSLPTVSYVPFLSAPAAATTTTLTDNGPNPSTSGQAVSFTVTVSGGSAISGETVTIEDADNADAVVASPTLTNSTATFSISNLSVGTHQLFAVYNGDTTHINSSDSTSPVNQVVNTGVPNITSVVINENISALYNAAGQPSPGMQRSMVDDVVYTFSEPVNILNPLVDPNVFTVAVASGWTGTVPTLDWEFVPGSGDTQWAVTFSGNGVSGGSIANGAYTITVTDPASITAISDGQALSLTANGIGSATQSFFRLFGDINGDGVVNAADNAKFKNALTTYNAAFDYNDDGVVNAADNAKFKNDLTLNFSGFTATI